jgi:hypothetical protein
VESHIKKTPRLLCRNKATTSKNPAIVERFPKTATFGEV